MKQFISKLNKNLHTQLQAIDLEESDNVRKAQKSVSCIKNALTQLKVFCIYYTFSDEHEEIHFYKNVYSGETGFFVKFGAK